MSNIVRMLRSEVQAASGQDQLGTGVKDGCAKVFHAARTMCRQSSERGIMARDIASAHQCLDRSFAAKEIAARWPLLLQPFLAWYGRETNHVWRTALSEIMPIPSSRGVDQGDPIASSVFSVAMAGPAEALRHELHQQDPFASVFQYADDVQVVTKTNLFAFVAQSTSRHWSVAGLEFKLSKDACWSLLPGPLMDPVWQAKRVDKLRCLGPDLNKEDSIHGEDTLAPDFEARSSGDDLSAARAKLVLIADKLVHMNSEGLSLQICQHLIRLGNSNLVQHILAAKKVPKRRSPPMTLSCVRRGRNSWDCPSQMLLGLADASPSVFVGHPWVQ